MGNTEAASLHPRPNPLHEYTMMQTDYLGKQNAPICLLALFVQAYCARRPFKLDNSTQGRAKPRQRARRTHTILSRHFQKCKILHCPIQQIILERRTLFRHVSSAAPHLTSDQPSPLKGTSRTLVSWRSFLCIFHANLPNCASLPMLHLVTMVVQMK